MTVRVYQNTDPDAPPLRGNTPGDLLNLLTKCLVDGYGDKPGAGWTRPFVSGNVGVFRQGPGGNDMCLRVDDSPPGGSRRAARVRGYVTMSDINTGAGPFPLDDQVSGGGYWFVQYNGTNGLADARPWLLIADENFFYLMIVTHPTTSQAPQFMYGECYFFGDIVEYGPTDVFGTLIGCGTSAANDAHTSEAPTLTLRTNLSSSANGNVFIARRWDQEGGSVVTNFHSDAVRGGPSYPGYQGVVRYPNGPDNRLYMAPVWIGDSHVPGDPVVRGHLPGFWNPLHATPFNRLDTFTGHGDLAGKEFITWRSDQACWAIETSDTWRG